MDTRIASALRSAAARLLPAAIAALLAPAAAFAATATVTVRNYEFSPASITVSRGDTVRWQWESGSHTVTSGASSQPADDPGALFDASINSVNTDFSYVFDTPGDYPYFCRPHELMGMRGSVTVTGDTAFVRTGNYAFSPATVTVRTGDTVTWLWVDGSHTTTSGASSQPADNPGALWNSPLDAAHPSFSYTFSQAGSFPYFCIPHEFMGMTGSVMVQAEATGVPGDGSRARTPGLALRAVPNPFRSGSVIRFRLAGAGEVRAGVLDPAGRRVRILASGSFPPGDHTLAWDGRDGYGRLLPAGVYLVRVSAPGGAETVKVVKTD